MSRKFREPVLIVLTVGMFFEPLATDGKNFSSAAQRDQPTA